MRILFAGTPDFAAAHLQSLLDNKQHEIVAVYTQPDRRAGRGKKLLPSPVKQLALEQGLAIEQPTTLKDAAAVAQLTQYQPELMVVVAYGMLLPESILAIPRYGCINVHASLLPRWRGAAPVERAIEAGDRQTGVTIMQMDAGLDTGDMLEIAACDISENETGDSLRRKLIALGKPALLKTITDIASGNTRPQKQCDAQSTYASKLEKSEAQINWHRPAASIARKIRALTSALSSHSWLDGQRIRIVEAEVSSTSTTTQTPGEIIAVDKKQLTVCCAEQALAISILQMPGGKAMPLGALLNGKPDLFKAGMIFTAIDNG